MILEQFPAVQELTRDQKLQLATELWEQEAPAPSPSQASAIHDLIESRMQAWRSDPSQAVSLDELKSRFQQLRNRG